MEALVALGPLEGAKPSDEACGAPEGPKTQIEPRSEARVPLDPMGHRALKKGAMPRAR